MAMFFAFAVFLSELKPDFRNEWFSYRLAILLCVYFGILAFCQFIITVINLMTNKIIIAMKNKKMEEEEKSGKES